MKVIDLLNKIANGEKVPKIIDINDVVYKYCDNINYYINEDNCYLFEVITPYHLNEEIEIIEEDKKIEKIKSLNNVGDCVTYTEFKDKQQLNNNILKDKINEIIGEIKKMKEGK